MGHSTTTEKGNIISVHGDHVQDYINSTLFDHITSSSEGRSHQDEVKFEIEYNDS